MLRIEVRRVCDYPVAALVRVDIPTIVVVPDDMLGHNALSMLDLFVPCLCLNVVRDRPLADRVGHRVAAENVLHRRGGIVHSPLTFRFFPRFAFSR